MPKAVQSVFTGLVYEPCCLLLVAIKLILQTKRKTNIISELLGQQRDTGGNSTNISVFS